MSFLIKSFKLGNGWPAPQIGGCRGLPGQVGAAGPSLNGTSGSKFIVRPMSATLMRDCVAMGLQFIKNRRLIVQERDLQPLLPRKFTSSWMGKLHGSSNKSPGLLWRTARKISDNQYKQTSFPGCLSERQGRFQTTGTSKQAYWVALVNDREDFRQPIQADKLPGLFARNNTEDLNLPG